MHTEKICLKWNQFEEKIKLSFKDLRKEKKLFDVTLATDDGFQIQAHRIILSAGSDFFSDIFSNYSQPNMLVYLKGIGRTAIENLTNFLYNGETSVPQNELNTFLEAAHELKVKGLQTVEDDYNHELKPDVFKTDLKTRLELPSDTEGNMEEDSSTVQHELIVPDLGEDFQTETTHVDPKENLEELVEKSLGVWKCKICDKTARDVTNIKLHAEIHLKGILHSCNICEKTFSTTNSLRLHLGRIHTKLYSCMSCGREDMPKRNLVHHNKRCKGIPQEQKTE